MSFNKSAIRGEAMTLYTPSGYGNQHNIMKDPSKSIHTKRKDKVNMGAITELMTQECNDRFQDSITVYARGVDPHGGSVMSNAANHAGANINGSTVVNQGKQASLPYKIMREGDFRFPANKDALTDSLPLSRKVVGNIKTISNPSAYKFATKLLACTRDSKIKNIKESVLKTTVKPTRSYKIEKSAQPTYDVQNHIQNDNIKTSTTSSLNYMDGTTQHIPDEIGGIIDPELILRGNNNTNMQNIKQTPVNILAVNDYVADDVLTGNFNTNVQNIKQTPVNILAVEDYVDEKVKTSQVSNINGYKKDGECNYDYEFSKNTPKHEAQTNTNDSRINKNIKHENEIVLERNTPSCSANTNNYSNKGTTILTTDKKLKETLTNIGSLECKPTRPSQNNHLNYNLKENLLNKVASKMLQNSRGNSMETSLGR